MTARVESKTIEMRAAQCRRKDCLRVVKVGGEGGWREEKRRGEERSSRRDGGFVDEKR